MDSNKISNLFSWLNTVNLRANRKNVSNIRNVFIQKKRKKGES